jgi:tetratricopeptide (TPR) repeat protein
MNETLLEKAELYVNGGMNDEERLLFEKEMAANEQLSSYVNLYKDIDTTMRNKEKHNVQEEALKESVKKLNAIYFNAPAAAISGAEETKTAILKALLKPGISTWKTLAIAAATIGVISISIFWYVQNKRTSKEIAGNTKKDSATAIINADTTHLQNEPSNIVVQNNNDTISHEKELATLTQQKRESLFKTNFKTDAVPVNIEGPLEDAFTYYNAQQYDDAATEFSTADLSSTRGSETDTELTAFYAYYYAGISYLAGNKTNKAITALNKALTKNTGTFMQVKAQWYLALAYVRTGEINKATGLLAEVSANNTESEYKSKAGVLLAELK